MIKPLERHMKGIFLFALLAAVAGCGYHVAGKGGKMPGGITSLSIPMFVNSTGKPDIEATMTSAFSTEFVTSVNVVKDNGDAVLRGVIKSYGLTPVSFTKSDVNQAYRLTVVLSVKIVQGTGGERVLWEDDNITDFEDFSVNINDISATRDREAEALRKISRDTARLTKEHILEMF